jgi:hypothetical protein
MCPGINLQELGPKHYLVHLSLARCHIRHLPLLQDMPNLQHLDLSHNQLRDVSIKVILELRNFKYLSLAHNPLADVHLESAPRKQTTMRRLDLSYTDLSVFNASLLSSFTSIQLVNLSQVGQSNRSPNIYPGGPRNQ